MFTARFDDGPMEGAVHEFLGPSAPYADVYAMPSPRSADAPWIIVGYTGMEPDPAHEWPGQVHYCLLATELLAEPVGHYVLDR